MSRFLAGLAVILCCAAGLTTPSFAQSQCKPEIVAAGKGAILDSTGRTNAIAAWRSEVVTRFGVFYGDAQKASEGRGVQIANCGRTLLGLMVCLARGRPCIAGPGSGTEIQCDHRDGPQCNPTVKWVQFRLNHKGAIPRLAVDGAAGPATIGAIHNFRRAHGLPHSSNIDAALIGALRT